MSRSGHLGFAHPALSEAVAGRYLRDDETRRAAHRRLAGYFLGAELNRRLEERPWQLAEAGDWGELEGELADPTLPAAAWPRFRLDLQRLWTRLEDQRGRRMAEAFRPWIELTGPLPAASWAAAMLLDCTFRDFRSICRLVQRHTDYESRARLSVL